MTARPVGVGDGQDELRGLLAAWLFDFSMRRDGKSIRWTDGRGITDDGGNELLRADTVRAAWLSETDALLPVVTAWAERRARERAAEAIDASHLAYQRQWSSQTFGPGPRTAGVCDHIRKELAEIEADPGDLGEWVDVIILAFDGAWRTGADPAEIIAAVKAKQARNEARTWPDWRTADPDRAIEHDRSRDALAADDRTGQPEISGYCADGYHARFCGDCGCPCHAHVRTGSGDGRST